MKTVKQILSECNDHIQIGKTIRTSTQSELLDGPTASLDGPTLLDEAATSKNKLSAYDDRKTFKDLPSTLVFQRKAIRSYPDHQIVGLYYAPAVDQYISLPYDSKSGRFFREESEDQNLTVDASKMKSGGGANTFNSLQTPSKNLDKPYKWGRDEPDDPNPRPRPNRDDVAKNLESHTDTIKGAIKKIPHVAKAVTLGAGGLIGAKTSDELNIRNAFRRSASGASEPGQQDTAVSAPQRSTAGRIRPKNSGVSVSPTPSVSEPKEEPKAEPNTKASKKTFKRMKRIPRGGGGPKTSDDLSLRNSFRQSANESTKERGNLGVIMRMIKHDIETANLVFEGKNEVLINNRIAKKIWNLYGSLNNKNRKEMAAMLNEDANSYRKIVNLAVGR